MENLSFLWIDVDLDSENISGPTVTREQLLPFQTLKWESFERLCFRLVSEDSSIIDSRLYGIRGQGQDGIDLYLREASKEGYTTWQCKKYEDFKPSDLTLAVDKFLEGDWAPRSSRFCLAVSSSFVPTQYADALREEVEKCRKRNIELLVHDQETLSASLKNHPKLVDDFFGPAWLKAFCGDEVAKDFARRKLTRKQRVNARVKLRALYETYFTAIDYGLPAAALRLRNTSRPLALSNRYVVPMVEQTTKIMEIPGQRPAPAENVNGASKQPNQQALTPKRGGPSMVVREERTTFECLKWLSTVDRAVILGGPGLGKSTALRFVALDLLSDNPSSYDLAQKWGSYLPVMIPFAFLTSKMSENPLGIMECCRAWFQSLSARPDEVKLFEEALEDERILLIVDGLDEWNNETAARTAMALLQSFVDSRKLPSFVSARRQGFERLGGFGAEWIQGELLPFSIELQQRFVFLWFKHFFSVASVEPDQSLIERRAELDARSLVKEIEEDISLTDLAGIPLLLSALIYLRLEGRVLPHNRFEVLESVANILIADQPLNRASASLQRSGTTRQEKLILERGITVIALAIHHEDGSEVLEEEKARESLSTFFEGNTFKKLPNEAAEIARSIVEQASQNIGILVERHKGHIGFLHRSLQEHLASKELAHLPFDDVKQFFVRWMGDSNWQEVLLGLLHQTKRTNEVDELLLLIKDTRLSPLEEPFRRMLLARALCSGANCSASLALEATEDLLKMVETSPWMPLRKGLAYALSRGIHSHHIGDLIRKRLVRWFPGNSKWRGGLFKVLASKPTADTKRGLLISLFNSNGVNEIKDVAETMAREKRHWPELVEELISYVGAAAEPELVGAIIHAIALGWPDDERLIPLLKEGVNSKNDFVRLISLIHTAKRGDQSEEIKLKLESFCTRDSRPYPWESEMLAILVLHWGDDAGFRNAALKSAPRPFVAERWSDRIALRFLIKAFPQDDEVATIISQVLSRREYLDPIFRSGDEWDDLRSNFAGHPIVVKAVSEWLQLYGEKHYNEMDCAHLALLSGSSECIEFLFQKVQKGGLVMWPVSTLLQMVGPKDPRLLAAVQNLIDDDRQAASLGDVLPQLMPNRDACVRRLIQLLEVADGWAVGHVLNGLECLGALSDPQVLALIERRLQDDNKTAFWFGGKSFLMGHYAGNPLVRAFALLELKEDDIYLTDIANAYFSDGVFRPILDRFLEPLNEDLRQEVIRSVKVFAFRAEDPFVRDFLSAHDCEPDGETRVAAADAYYSALKRIDSNCEGHVAKLQAQLKATGPSYNERAQSAAIGLIVLGKAKLILETKFDGDRAIPKIWVNTDTTPNWALMRVLVREWEGMMGEVGDRAWEIFDSQDLIVVELNRSGRRDLALRVPEGVSATFLVHIEQNLSGFRALTVIKKGTPELLEICFGLFSRFSRDHKEQVRHWGFQELEVMIEAAHYIGRNYGGNMEIGHRLEQILQKTMEPTAVIIALCVGWPGSTTVQSIWDSHAKNEEFGGPDLAWLMSAKAPSQDFVRYVLNFPETLRSGWYRFPAEKMRAATTRLARDQEAQKILLEVIDQGTNDDHLAIALRLLGEVGAKSPNLKSWLNSKIESVRRDGSHIRMHQDIFWGQARPLEFCLLEAFLLRSSNVG